MTDHVALSLQHPADTPGTQGDVVRKGGSSLPECDDLLPANALENDD